jgi:hypothetical protein
MTHQSQTHFAHTPIDAGSQVAQLRHVLRLVGELAGRGTAPGADDAALDESARISSAYDHALPIVRRRFDALAGETAAWSAAAIEALLLAGDQRSPAAARRLADELEAALRKLTALLPQAEVPDGLLPQAIP